MDMQTRSQRAAAEGTFMDDALCPDRSLEYPLHKQLFSFKRKGASNALFKTSGPAFGVHVRYHGKVTKHARDMPQSIKPLSLVESFRCFCSGDGIQHSEIVLGVEVLLSAFISSPVRSLQRFLW